MSETHFKAPSADENVAGPRAFAYVAEVDVMGWKFRVMYDGSFQIDLPTMPVDDLPVSPMFAAGPGVTAILEALLATSSVQSNTVAQFGADANGLGTVVRL